MPGIVKTSIVIASSEDESNRAVHVRKGLPSEEGV